jgi:Tol biopolymer transport system component
MREVSLVVVVVILGACLAFLAGCGGGGGEATLTSISIEPNGATVEVTHTQQFVSTAHYDDGSTDEVSATWTVTGSLGAIGNDGLFTAGAVAGSGSVQATYEGQTASVPVTVIAGPLASITVEPSSVTLDVGETQQFTATGYDQYGNEPISPTWSVEGGIGDIDANGLFEATAAGTGQVVAAVGGIEGRANVTAAVPPGLGRIAFTSNRDGIPEIYVMNSDGTNQVNLTHNPVYGGWSPSWSPDGSKIAFVSSRLVEDPPGVGWLDIYVMNSDGSNQTNLTNNSIGDGDPCWSPDGSKIAFYSDREGFPYLRIYVMNSDGSNQTKLTNNPADDMGPSWSPDGSKMAFFSNRDGNYEIYVMNSDGTNQVNLTNNPFDDEEPSWSPDGSKIAFTSNRDGGWKILVMNSDGSNQTNLSNNGVGGDDPCWSPDGSKIAFTSEGDGLPYLHIYVMNSDGTNQTYLTNNPANDYAPSWSPF